MEQMIREDKKKLRLRKKLMLGARGQNRSLYLLAFFLPMAVLELCYITFQVFPFGNDSLLVLDLNAQYIYYYEGFRDAILGDGSLIYSWSRTLGGETFGLNAYYMGSPFMLVYLLFPKTLITEALLTTALLRTGCAALSFAYYLKTTRGGETNRILIVSMMYALMTYMVMQQMDPMWLDAVIGLPLIMLGVERLIQENKFLLYTSVLAAVFISNFYIGYMVAIFTAVYFLYAYFTTCTFGKGNAVRFLKKGLLFAFFSVLAAGIAAFMLIPAYHSLTLGKMDFSSPNFTPKAKFKFVDVIPKLLFGAYDTCRPEGLPTLFTGTLTLILLPLYFTNRNINIRKKILSAAVLFFLFMSMNISTLDLAWHGFQNPNWLNYRYSFIACAFMLVMAYDAFHNVRGGYTVASVARASLLVLAMILFTDFQGYEYVDARITVWGGLLILLLYFSFVAFDAYRQGARSRVVTGVLLGFVCAELYANGITTLVRVDQDVVFSSRDTYRDFVDQSLPAAEWLKEYDDGFYRSEKTYMRCVNDPFAFGMKGISHSSSTLNRDGINYIKKLGYPVGAHWTEYSSPVLSTDAILGIKYVFQKNETNNGLNLIHQEGDIFIYENPHAMPLCFPVSPLYEGYDAELDTDNPFDIQNAMLSAMAGSEEILPFYTPVDSEKISVDYENIQTKAYAQGYTKYYSEISDQNCHIEFRVSGVEGKTLYAAFPTDYARKVNLWLNGEYFDTYLTNNDNDGIIPLGQYGEDESATLLLGLPLKSQGGSEEVFLKEKLFYAFDSELFEQYFAPMREAVSNFTQKSTTRFSMDITASAGDILYLSIPYEPGWHMTADGEDVEVCRTGDGLIGITLLEGTHSYTLRFLPDYFVYSCILSAASLLLLVGLVLLERRFKRRGAGLPSLRALAEAGAAENPDQLTAVERPADLPDLAEGGETDEQSRRAYEILFTARPDASPPADSADSGREDSEPMPVQPHSGDTEAEPDGGDRPQTSGETGETGNDGDEKEPE